MVKLPVARPSRISSGRGSASSNSIRAVAAFEPPSTTSSWAFDPGRPETSPTFASSFCGGIPVYAGYCTVTCRLRQRGDTVTVGTNQGDGTGDAASLDRNDFL